MQVGYFDVLEFIELHGDKVSPRGMETLEVQGVSLEVADTSRCMPMFMNRKANTALGIAEALQLISGTTYPALMARIAPTMSSFMNVRQDGPPYFHGAYGPRVLWQLPLVIDKLARDRESRQAVVTIFDPELDYTPGMNDVPCTVFLQFLVRNDGLDMHVYMRSNDVWWGLAYDVFQFTQLQHTMARCLGLQLGSYTHHATSLHMYTKDVAAAHQVHAPTEPMPRILGVGHADSKRAPVQSWDHYQQRAETLLVGQLPEDASQSEVWMSERMGRYAAGLGRDVDAGR